MPQFSRFPTDFARNPRLAFGPAAPRVARLPSPAGFVSVAWGLAFSLLAATSVTLGQAPATTTTGPLPGHSYHGEAFNEGPRHQAYLMERMPKIEFPITTTAPLAQRFFEQGIGQLHGFWYFEAERSFRQVAFLDARCAMAYCGMAMANINNEGRARNLIAKAVELKSAASPREAMWIDAWNGFLTADASDAEKNKARRLKLVRDLESLIHEFPEDLEAKAFLALQIWLNRDFGLPINSHQAIDSVLSEVLTKNPLHPAHHYRIHLWDYEKPARARLSAASCGQSGPGIAHLWHMSGHIFSDLERYGDAAWQQEASARVDHAYMIRDGVLPYQIHNYAHNNEWLIRDLTHVGRARDAIRLAKNLIEIPRHPALNQLSQPGSAQFGRVRLFDALRRFEMWEELLALTDSAYLPPTDDPLERIKWSRARGAAWFGLGNLERGKQALAELEMNLTQVEAEQNAAGLAAEVKAKEEKKPDDQVAQAKTAAMNEFAARVPALKGAIAELKGLAALAAGDFSSASGQFDAAGGIEKEFLARVAIQAGDAAKAEQLAREAVQQGRNQVLPLANLAFVLERVGKTPEAAQVFEELRNLASAADFDAAAMRRLEPLARGLGMPADWRNKPVIASDTGDRPAIGDLGPLEWRPSPAPPWTLVDGAGASRSLAEYQGKPVVVLLYLGFGCTHCVEQLKAFAPLASRYAEAGISLLAISSESPDSLKKALEARAAEGGFPFPILSDEGLAVFKANRAYDDFEGQPLHATMLIDGAGLARWREIGYQPFSDANFLLEESKRLLALPPQATDFPPPVSPPVTGG